jgi:hypothetical protein
MKEADEDSVPTSVSVLSAVEVPDEELSDNENRESLDLSHAAIQTNLEFGDSKNHAKETGRQHAQVYSHEAMRYNSDVEVGTRDHRSYSCSRSRSFQNWSPERLGSGNGAQQRLVCTSILLDYYKLGTPEGLLPHMFIRTGFEPCLANHLSLDNVDASSATTLRASAASASQSGGML